MVPVAANCLVALFLLYCLIWYRFFFFCIQPTERSILVLNLLFGTIDHDAEVTRLSTTPLVMKILTLLACANQANDTRQTSTSKIVAARCVHQEPVLRGAVRTFWLSS